MTSFIEREDADVHTEHCCILHGCKYCDDACTVATRAKKQTWLNEKPRG